jgi:hypothetical protein
LEKVLISIKLKILWFDKKRGSEKNLNKKTQQKFNFQNLFGVRFLNSAHFAEFVIIWC